MAKFIVQDVTVMVNSVDLSDHAFSIDTPETRDQIDVSGFNATGAKEFLPGALDQTITVGFLNDTASGKVFKTLQPLFAGGSTFPIVVTDKSTTPKVTFSGTASMFDFNGLSGQLGARAEMTATFKPATNSTFAWGTA